MAEWIEIERSSVADAATALPALTVLAATPGWGRTTWMRQLQRGLVADGGPTTDWIEGRASAERWLAEHRDAPTTVFLDDVLRGDRDPLWQEIRRCLQRNLPARFVVSTPDLPPDDLPGDRLVLTEADLGFTAGELSALVRNNLPDRPSTRLTGVDAALLQHPQAARAHISWLHEHADYPSPESRLSLSLLAALRGLPTALREQSTMLSLIEAATRFRRASPELLAALDEIDQAPAASQFLRLGSYPFGGLSHDEETGQIVFEWSDQIWQAIQAAVPEAELMPRLRQARDASARAGHIGMQAFYLAELRDLDALESLIDSQLRLFLLTTDDVTYHALLDLPWSDLARCPSTLLLLGELHVRRTGSARSVEHYFTQVLDLLDPTRAAEPFDTYRLTCRRLFAAVSLGNRERTRRGLDAAIALLEGDAGTGLLTTLAARVESRGQLAAELYLPFWAAIQLDDHALALRLASWMRVHADPTSPTATAERLTALTQYIFCGADDPPATAPSSHADPLLLLDSGADADALELVRILASRRDSSPSRSAVEALVLLVRALAAPTQLNRSEIEESLARSRGFWRDGRSSSFLAAAAALAYLALGDPASARVALRCSWQTDWFVHTAGAVLDLVAHRPSEAVLKLDLASRCRNAPRAGAIVATLTAVAHLHLGRQEAALARFQQLAEQSPAPLVRFALRFVSPADFDALVELCDRAGIARPAGLDLAHDDARHLCRIVTGPLTATEREILALLREGRTNAEIAQHRVVSLNTVRTQLRKLYRKLGVTGRDELVTRAERLRYFEKAADVPAQAKG